MATKTMEVMNEVILLDLFSGIGGFHLGFQEAGYNIKSLHSEVDKYTCQVYHEHFPKSECLGDVKSITSIGNKKIDLLTFGFPCQDVSIAGPRGGLEAKRSGLFYEAMRIIRFTRPSVFILENVKGIFSSSEGRDFEIVLREIADIGLYECQWQLVNTSWFLPQNRERLYLVGYLRRKHRPEIFPIRETGGGVNEGAAKTTIRCLTGGGHSGGHHSGMSLMVQTGTIGQGGQGQRIYDINGISTTLTSSNKEVTLIEDMFTLTNQDIHGVQTGQRIRRLTPVECERLQGFPDGWTCSLSDTQRYKTLGNAVTVDVVREIATRLKPYWEGMNGKN